MTITKQELFEIAQNLGYDVPIDLSKASLIDILRSQKPGKYPQKEAPKCQVQLDITGLVGSQSKPKSPPKAPPPPPPPKLPGPPPPLPVKPRQSPPKNIKKNSPKVIERPDPIQLLKEEMKLKQNLMKELEKNVPNLAQRQRQVKWRAYEILKQKYPGIRKPLKTPPPRPPSVKKENKFGKVLSGTRK